MRTEYKHNPPIPYSLHDMRVKKIIIQDKTIVLEFEDGYEKLTEPFEQVEGNITIEGVDFDCTCVMNDIDNMLCNFEVKKYALIDKNELQTFRLNYGDVLFNRTNSYEFVGRTGIFYNNRENFVFASYLVRLVCNKEILLPEYLTVFLNTHIGKKEIRRRARPSINQTNVNPEELKEIKIPIFPMEFQLEIQNLVKDSHKALEESKELYKKAEETLYLELGLDPKNPLQSLLDSKTNNPTNSPNISIHTLKESFLKTGRLDSEYYQSKYEDIEKMIRSYKDGFCNLKDLVNDISSGFAFSSDDYQDVGELVLIRINNIKNATLDLSNVIYLKNEAYNLSPKDKIKKGDILISMSGSIGLSCVVRDDISAMVNQRILKISIKNFNSDVLVLLLNSFICKMQFERIGTGGVQTNLSSIDMQNILIPKIDSTTQEKIAKYIQESFNLRKKSKQLLDNAKIKVEEQIQGKI
ncbi:restriction endonuclease subunit S [Campylobacter jejuni]|uniref:restriction endonuclease subunit S n=1 Tax=Campylobacter jejuni TaxID=197 RepID=UPI00069A093A|nr:restriction endonuclease subunit S [Campylobacter jejuni]